MANHFLLKTTFFIHEHDEEIIFTVLEGELNLNPNSYQEPSWKDKIQIQVYHAQAEKEILYQSVSELLQDLVMLEVIAPLDYVLVSEPIKEEDWMNHWKEYFTPILIGKSLQVTPSWYPPNLDRINILLEPKMGFGTGQHATTFLCLEAMEMLELKNQSILDIGAGSGILGVGAALLGAQFVLMVEIDPLAMESCQDTIERNHVQDIVSTWTGDIFQIPAQYQHGYDRAFINIVAEVIVEILELEWLKKVPHLYLSGILYDKKSLVTEALMKHNRIVETEKKLGDWVLIVAS